jgi:hypothetical protein
MELTQEQKEAFEKIVKVANSLYEWMKKVVSKGREALIRSWNYFKAYIMELPPKQRYKLLKSMGIKNYLPFSRRDGVIHCRNNC